MAERLVVPMKPGNSGGGKGPQLKADARSDDEREIGDEPDNSQVVFQKLADGVTCSGLGDCVSLLRERMRQIRTSGSMSGVWKRKHAGAGEAPTDERVGNR